MKVEQVIGDLKRRFPNEPEYHQAVEEVLSSIEEVYNSYPEFENQNLIERLCIPERIFSFRITWVDDRGKVQTNMAPDFRAKDVKLHSSTCKQQLYSVICKMVR